ncbi:DUF636 domain protein, partial [Eremomyces bilateralis CBS 781.70]
MANLTGSCACGTVKYEVTSPPLKHAICHCVQCRKATGSAFSTNTVVPRPAFQLIAGVPNTQTYTFIQAESSIPFTLRFCTTCGSTVVKVSEHESFRDVALVAAGTADVGFDTLKADTEFWTVHRAGWLGAVEGAVE